MSEVTLTVPAEYADLFTLGVVHELMDNTKWMRDHQAALIDDAMGVDRPRSLAGDERDVLASKAHMDEAAAMVDQLFAAKAGAPVEIRVGPHTGTSVAAHALEALVKDVIAPKLTSLADYSPLSENLAAGFMLLAGATEWAASEAPALHDRSLAERREQMGEVV